jgi:hypothetical protein
MTLEYDVERETEFSRNQLQTRIPTRLDQLLSAVNESRRKTEDWYANLVAKIIIGIARSCDDLLKTIEQEALSAAAWNARNLLELWVWTSYCSASRENARRFHDDAVRDFIGLIQLNSKMAKSAGIEDVYTATNEEKLRSIAVKSFGLESFDSNYTKVADAAKAVGLEKQYAPAYRFLSKLAHPTAGLVIGIMHQSEVSLRGLQASCTTQGLYYAGQCVIMTEKMVSQFAALPHCTASAP